MHLHVHSYYSFLSGTLSVDRIVEHAVRRGYRAVALTDTNNVSGVTEFVIRCREAGIVPIIGAELRAGTSSAVILARNVSGYRAVCEAVTRLAERYPPARIQSSESDQDEGLGADRGIEVRTSRSKRGTPSPDVRFLVDTISPWLGRDIFLLSGDASVISALRESDTDKALYVELTKAGEHRWPKLLALAARLELPVVATNAVCFGEPDGIRLHRVLRAIGTNKTIGTLEEDESAHPARYFCSEEDFARWFSAVPEALHARGEIAESCEVAFDFTTSKFTTFDDCGGMEKSAFLRRLAEDGFAERYPRPTPVHHERLRKELDIIARLGFVDYFLVAWDIVRYAHRRNFPYIGRGSGANSIVAYCLRITNVDPIELDLYFERFLNPERRSPPDFDIDFSWRDRDEVIDYVLGKYGRSRTAMIGTIVTFNARGALRETGKALGFSEAEIRQCTALLPGYGSIRDMQDPDSPFRRQAEKLLATPYGKQWFTIATRLLDFPNHYGVHAGGVILAPKEMTWYTATQTAPKGVRITQQDMFSMEDWRLEKIDILSTRGLGTFQDTLRMVEERTGARPPIDDVRIACADERTREIVREGQTIGCFYIESPAMVQLLKKLRADTFEMLTAASSIIRPGVAQSGMMQAFIERFHNPQTVRHLHPLMGEILHATYGVMVYQEDVIKVAHIVGKLTLGEADLLRRAMSGKMRSREAMHQLRIRFFEGCRSRGIDDAVTAEIWRQMESFAGYSFCKAHSASYAVLSFQEAYLKAHYPAFFLCSVLNNQGGYYRPDVYVQEAKRLGIRVLLPDVNTSGELHSCPDERTIQLGFLHIKNLTIAGVKSLIGARERGGPFTSIGDFLERSGVHFEDAAILIRCGACDRFGLERSAMYVQAKLMLAGKRHRSGAELPLPFPDFSGELAHLPPYSPQEIAHVELETFSFTVSDHILRQFSQALTGTVHAPDLPNRVGRRVVVGGWLIAAKPARTRKGERMMFLNLDDSFGRIDVVVFPACYRKYGHLLQTAGPYRIHGRVAEEYGVVTIVADRIETVEADNTAASDPNP
ncbi:MAG: DNA polymerase III subunit alpha [Bacteroidota bacterium]|nr:DNA polymerase III subunit alpha [Bacteroidota bacterium]